MIAPIPVNAKAGFTIKTSDPNVISYTIINSLGAKVAIGNFTRETTLSIPKAGVYTIIFGNGTDTFAKKILVK